LVGRPALAEWVAAAIIILAALFSLSLNLPGHLSYDSVVQLAEGRAGDYSGYHPLVMSWLLGIADAIRPGAALFVVFDTALIAGALLAFVLLGRGRSWAAPALAAACAASPQLLIYPAIVWKDVLFAGSATAGFACLALAATAWERPARRYLLLGAGLLLVTLAALSRQNGAIILPFTAGGVGWIAARTAASARRGWAAGLGFLTASALIALGATAALNSRSDREPVAREQWENLRTWDIVSALTLEPRMELTVLHARAPWLETLLRTDGVALYSPIRADSLEGVLTRMEARAGSAGLIAAQWRQTVLRHPLTYLRARARAFGWVLLTPAAKDCVLVFTGLDGPRDEMGTLGLVRRRTPRDRGLANYALAFAGTPVYSHAAYGAIGLVLLAALARRRRPADIVVAAMLASALAFALSFAVISISCDYRYIYYLDLAVMAGALYGAATWNPGAGSAAPGR